MSETSATATLIMSHTAFLIIVYASYDINNSYLCLIRHFLFLIMPYAALIPFSYALCGINGFWLCRICHFLFLLNIISDISSLKNLDFPKMVHFRKVLRAGLFLKQRF